MWHAQDAVEVAGASDAIVRVVDCVEQVGDDDGDVDAAVVLRPRWASGGRSRCASADGDAVEDALSNAGCKLRQGLA